VKIVGRRREMGLRGRKEMEDERRQEKRWKNRM
jgi:hypothetical protein